MGRHDIPYGPAQQKAVTMITFVATSQLGKNQLASHQSQKGKPHNAAHIASRAMRNKQVAMQASREKNPAARRQSHKGTAACIASARQSQRGAMRTNEKNRSSKTAGVGPHWHTRSSKTAGLGPHWRTHDRKKQVARLMGFWRNDKKCRKQKNTTLASPSTI